MSSKLRNTAELQNVIMCIVLMSALWSSKQLFSLKFCYHHFLHVKLGLSPDSSVLGCDGVCVSGE